MECVDKDKIVVMGYSLGTGVATYVASQKEVNGLILVAPYDCALNLCNNVLNIFHGPLKLLARYDFDSISYAKDVKTLPLIITSKSDEVINCELSLNLSKHFPIVPEFLLLDYVGHDYYFDQSTTLRCINRYLQEKAPSTIENENM
jgi:dienelactone hydrolase